MPKDGLSQTFSEQTDPAKTTAQQFRFGPAGCPSLKG